MWFRRQRQEVLSLDASLEDGDSLGLMQIEDTHLAPDEAYERKALKDEVSRAVEALPEKQRLVITLHYMADMSYQEIAQFLNVPLSTVRSRLQVGRKQLKKEMLKTMEDVFAQEKPGPEFAEQLLVKAWNLFDQQGEPQQALTVFQKLMEKYPDTEAAVEAHMLMANLYRSLGQLDEQIEILEDVLGKLDMYPDAPYAIDVHLSLSEAYYRKEDFERALGVYEAMLEKYPEEPHSLHYDWNGIGRCYELNGLLDKAREAYQIALERAPDDVGARSSLMRLEGCDDIPEATLNELRRLRAEASEIFYRKMEYDKAIPFYQKLIELGGQSAYGLHAQTWLGVCYELTEQLDKSIGAFRIRSERYTPAETKEDKQLWQLTLRGMDYEHHAQYEKALAEYDAILGMFRQGLAFNPWLLLKTWYRKGRCYEKMERFGDAKKAHQSLLNGTYLNAEDKERALADLRMDWVCNYWITEAEKALKIK